MTFFLNGKGTDFQTSLPFLHILPGQPECISGKEHSLILKNNTCVALLWRYLKKIKLKYRKAPKDLKIFL